MRGQKPNVEELLRQSQTELLWIRRQLSIIAARNASHTRARAKVSLCKPHFYVILFNLSNIQQILKGLETPVKRFCDGEKWNRTFYALNVKLQSINIKWKPIWNILGSASDLKSCAQEMFSQFDRSRMLLEERVGKYWQVKMCQDVPTFTQNTVWFNKNQ